MFGGGNRKQNVGLKSLLEFTKVCRQTNVDCLENNLDVDGWENVISEQNTSFQEYKLIQRDVSIGFHYEDKQAEAAAMISILDSDTGNQLTVNFKTRDPEMLKALNTSPDVSPPK